MRFFRISPVALAILAFPVGLAAQQGAAKAPPSAGVTAAAKVTEETPGLLAKAKITSAKAIATARTAAPKGAVFSKGEIEEEDGRLVYTLQFTVTGKKGVREINVDAVTGKIVADDDEHGEHTDDPVDPDAAC